MNVYCIHTFGVLYAAAQQPTTSNGPYGMSFCVLCIARLSKQPRAKHQCSRNDTTRKQRWAPGFWWCHWSSMQIHTNDDRVTVTVLHTHFYDHNRNAMQFLKMLIIDWSVALTRPFCRWLFLRHSFDFLFFGSAIYRLREPYSMRLHRKRNKTIAIFSSSSAHSETRGQLLTPPLDAVYTMHYSLGNILALCAVLSVLSTRVR